MTQTRRKKDRKHKRHTPRSAGAMATANLAILSKRLEHGNSHLIFGAKLCQEQMQLLHTRFWKALEDIKQGNQAEYAWSSIGQMLNMTLCLCELGVGAEHIQVAITAQEAFARARQRGDVTGRYLMDGPGIAALTEALELHDEQTKYADHDDVLRAERMANESIAQGNTYQFLNHDQHHAENHQPR